MSPCQGEGRGFDSRLALSKIEKKPDFTGFFFNRGQFYLFREDVLMKNFRYFKIKFFVMVAKYEFFRTYKLEKLMR